MPHQNDMKSFSKNIQQVLDDDDQFERVVELQENTKINQKGFVKDVQML